MEDAEALVYLTEKTPTWNDAARNNALKIARDFAARDGVALDTLRLNAALVLISMYLESVPKN